MRIRKRKESTIASDTTTKKKNKETGTDHAPILLSEDVVEAILSRLPVKSLIRFQRVCRSWQYLIYDEWFIKKQQESSSLSLVSSFPIGDTLPNLFKIDPNGNIEQQTPMLKRDFAKFRLQSNSVNGLICQVSVSYTARLNGEVNLMNPSTQEIMKLPQVGNHSSLKGSEHVYPQCIALGFDVCTGKYMLVMMYDYYLGNMAKYPCMVLTIGIDGEWRYVGDSPYGTFLDRPVFLNGAIHYKVSDFGDEFRILAFDLKEEKFRTVSCPEEFTTSSMFLRSTILIGVGAHLSLVVEERKCLSIWMLDDYADRNWTKKYVVDTSGPEWRELQCYHTVGIKDDKIMLQGKVRDILQGKGRDSEDECVFCSYDLCEKVWKVSRIPFSSLHFYSESLVSPLALL